MRYAVQRLRPAQLNDLMAPVKQGSHRWLPPHRGARHASCDRSRDHRQQLPGPPAPGSQVGRAKVTLTLEKVGLAFWLAEPVVTEQPRRALFESVSPQLPQGRDD
jgi:hypothetical protein